MNETGYCEKHQRAFEFKRIPGSWAYECPECREEGLYNTYTATCTKMKPSDEWTMANGIGKGDEWARKTGN